MSVMEAIDPVIDSFGIVILTYFVILNCTYILITLTAIVDVREHLHENTYEPLANRMANPFVPGVSILVPAYNEEPVIVDSIKSLLSLEYPDYEIIVINDGSTDGTLLAIQDAFELIEIEGVYPVDLPSEPVRSIYRAVDEELVVLDKENGGKSDALNAGVFYTEQELFCAIDADSLIQHGSLYDAVEPFLEKPTSMIATGGAVRVANGCRVEDGVVREVSLPKNRLVRLQVVEYLRAFLAGRIGLSRLKSLLIISGAFGLFRVDAVRDIGGYDPNSITEDMEIVVRLHRYMMEQGKEYDVRFLPEPVVWTEIPRDANQLAQQRRRWYRGLLYTLVSHRDAIFRREYGLVGLFALPFFLFMETLGPLVEGMGYVLLPVLIVVGMVHIPFFTTFLFGAVMLGALLSALGVYLEVTTYRRYEDPRDIARLLGYGVVEAFIYRPWKSLHSWIALYEFIQGDRGWGEMTRGGFDEE